MKDNLNDTLADAVMDRPREFFIGNRRFCLWSPTLGMSMMVDRHIRELGIDFQVLSTHPTVEALRLAKEKKKEVCDILAILSFRRFFQLSNAEKLKNRSEFFYSILDDDELAKLILLFLREPNAENLISLSGIANDQKELSAIIRTKNASGNSRNFGGKTIFGSLLDAACKTYGWTKHYVVWGIDLISLRMMLADTVNSIYLSDEEVTKSGISALEKDQIGMKADDFAILRKEFQD